MTRIRPSWTPASLDSGTSDHSLGWDFSADTAITANGLWWYHPNHANKPATVTAELYLTGTQALLATSGSVSTSGFSVDAWNFVAFSSAYSASASTNYTASVYSTGAAGYGNTDLSSSITSGDGHVTVQAHQGRFLNAAGAQFPTTTWDGMHGVDLDYTLGWASQPGAPALIVASGQQGPQPRITTRGPSILGPQAIPVAPFATNRPPRPPAEPPITAMAPPLLPPQARPTAPILIAPQGRILPPPLIAVTPAAFPPVVAGILPTSPINVVTARGQGQLATVITLLPAPLPQAAAPVLVTVSSWRPTTPPVFAPTPPLLPPYPAVALVVSGQRQPAAPAPTVFLGRFDPIIPAIQAQTIFVTAWPVRSQPFVFVGRGVIGAEDVCTVPRPNSGTVTRPGAGTVTRPNTGIVEDPC